jgi:hypothetical protein
LFYRRRPRLQRTAGHPTVVHCHAAADSGREWNTSGLY